MIVDRDWLLCPHLFTPEQCDLIIKEAMDIRSMAGDMTWKETMPDQPEIRSSTLRWIHRVNGQLGWAFTIADLFLEAARQHFGVRSHPFDAFQFAEYHAQRLGHYDWHRDDFPEQKLAKDRVLSLCIQLSPPDDYGGGQLELQVPNTPPAAVIRRRGAAIIFRSSTQHRVTRTVTGTRYSAVAWEIAA